MKKNTTSHKENTLFSSEEESIIIEAIKSAERKTSGEIRVHISSAEVNEDSLSFIESIFEKHKMYETKERNAVLLYLSIPSKKIFIYGDKGINAVVPENFWDNTIHIMIPYFKENKFCEGITFGLLQVGDLLKKYFPYTNDDINELDDEISYS